VLGESGSHAVVDEAIVSKHLGTIVTVILAAITWLLGWAKNLSTKISTVDARSRANASDIAHMRGDLTELKQSTSVNHKETIRLLERLEDRIQTIMTRISGV